MTFDHYHVWLGVAPKDQPPDHYRLLGIQQFESETKVIENAADSRMRHIRTFQNGPHAQQSQQILNELTQARLCLLNPNTKARYDSQLREETQSEATTLEVEADEQPTRGPANFAIENKVRQRPLTRDSKRWIVPAGLFGAILVGVAVASFAIRADRKDDRQTAKSGQQDSERPQRGETPDVKTGGSTTKPIEQSQPKPNNEKATGTKGDNARSAAADPTDADSANSHPDKSSGAQKSGTTKTGENSTAKNSPAGKTATTNSKQSETTGIPTSTTRGKSQDLLIVASPTRHAVDGNWSKTADGALRSTTEKSFLTLPIARLPLEYELSLDVVRLEGHDVLGIGVPLPHSAIEIVLDFKGRLSGFNFVDGVHIFKRKDFRYTTPNFPPGLVTNVLITVTRQSLTLHVNDKKTLELQGSLSRLGATKDVFKDGQLGLFTKGAAYEIRRIELTPLNTTDRLSIPDAKVLQQETQKFRAEFKPGYDAAKKLRDISEQRAALAKLAKEAVQLGLEETNPAARFVKLRVARDLGMEGGDSETCFEAIRQLALEFDIDAHQRKLDVVTNWTGGSMPRKTRLDLITVSEDLIESADEAGRYEIVNALLRLGRTNAQKTHLPQLATLFSQQIAFHAELIKKYEEAKQAELKLKSKPDDVAANEVMGIFDCFYRQLWDEGLPRLATSTSAAVRDAAIADLKNPTRPEEKLSVGDKWWEIAKEPLTQKAISHIQARADLWYRQAYPHLTRADKSRIKIRMNAVRTAVGRQFAQRIVGRFWEIHWKTHRVIYKPLILLPSGRWSAGTIEGRWTVEGETITLLEEPDGKRNRLFMENGAIVTEHFMPGKTVASNRGELIKPKR